MLTFWEWLRRRDREERERVRGRESETGSRRKVEQETNKQSKLWTWNMKPFKCFRSSFRNASEIYNAQLYEWNNTIYMYGTQKYKPNPNQYMDKHMGMKINWKQPETIICFEQEINQKHTHTNPIESEIYCCYQKRKQAHSDFKRIWKWPFCHVTEHIHTHTHTPQTDTILPAARSPKRLVGFATCFNNLWFFVGWIK